MLEIGSMVQFGSPLRYGVIKVINCYSSNPFAEIETVSIIIMYMHGRTCIITDVNMKTYGL